ncbi:MAG: RdgB/HAM1 family non-canonical purine NTP pyrophosphatase [Candidatus Omnitrophica bacterium]|nr:RdgB/HAM1 family non-canonical purine NTP pyrophosphatase [Candidatus Omnitrophota bacterium]MDD5236253.1 RdgB/HAM1 family non-canonical purine NTP pyrophosphatase [Candidatus Omnitrophota bacterium]MDD5611039.1 RdgB/HAM1 family non-canonical purine NTP pyrophosphatase [Candidatus Omnitrophota bacterium]
MGRNVRLELVVATKNKKKLGEIKDLLKGLKVKVTSLADYAHPPRIIENGETFKENARIKALKISAYTGKLTLGEDSGLEVAALNNAPGVRSSRFSGKNKSDKQNNLKLLRLLEGFPLKERKARYRCSVALADKKGLVFEAEGGCSGLIGFKEKGYSGFGYDPLFIIPKYKKTFAQLGLKVKHKMSHRYRALKKLRKVISAYLKNNL